MFPLIRQERFPPGDVQCFPRADLGVGPDRIGSIPGQPIAGEIDGGRGLLERPHSLIDQLRIDQGTVARDADDGRGVMLRCRLMDSVQDIRCTPARQGNPEAPAQGDDGIVVSFLTGGHDDLVGRSGAPEARQEALEHRAAQNVCQDLAREPLRSHAGLDDRHATSSHRWSNAPPSAMA
jgi:hypothetical protein